MSKKKQLFEGVVEPIRRRKPFYVAIMDVGMEEQDVTKHEDLGDAFQEAMKISKEKNKKVYIFKSVAEIEQIPHIYNHKD